MKNPDKKYDCQQYLEHFSTGISQEIQDYVTNVALAHSRYIFLTTEKETQYGYCTHCKNTFTTDKVTVEIEHLGNKDPWTPKGKIKHNINVICPICSSQCITKNAGIGRKFLRDSACVVYYEKSEIDRNTIVARNFYIYRNYSGEYKEVSTQYKTEYWYVFKVGEPPIMLKSDYLFGQVKGSSVYSGFKKYTCGWSYPRIGLYCSSESIYKAIESTPFQYSPYKKYINSLGNNDMVDFFARYSRFPVIEILYKLGFEDIADEKLQGYCTYERAINWKGKTLQNFLICKSKISMSLKRLLYLEERLTPAL